MLLTASTPVEGPQDPIDDQVIRSDSQLALHFIPKVLDGAEASRALLHQNGVFSDVCLYFIFLSYLYYHVFIILSSP